MISNNLPDTSKQKFPSLEEWDHPDLLLTSTLQNTFLTTTPSGWGYCRSDHLQMPSHTPLCLTDTGHCVCGCGTNVFDDCVRYFTVLPHVCFCSSMLHFPIFILVAHQNKEEHCGLCGLACDPCCFTCVVRLMQSITSAPNKTKKIQFNLHTGTTC